MVYIGTMQTSSHEELGVSWQQVGVAIVIIGALFGAIYHQIANGLDKLEIKASSIDTRLTVVETRSENYQHEKDHLENELDSVNHRLNAFDNWRASEEQRRNDEESEQKKRLMNENEEKRRKIKELKIARKLDQKAADNEMSAVIRGAH